MNPFPAVPLPSWPAGGVPPETLSREVGAWVESPALKALVEVFGGKPPAGTVADQLAYLDSFSAVWDTRGGGERCYARYPQYAEETQELIHAATGALGLAGRSQPQSSRYDHLLVLGGGRITSRARARYAAHLLETGVTAGPVVGLSSLRVLPPPIVDTDPGSAADLIEGQAMLRGLQEAFTPSGPAAERTGVTADGNDWWVRSYPAGERTVHVVAAPVRRSGQRANTADTLHGWIDLISRPAASETALLVTTDLYTPLQHADAIATVGLELRCGIETVGLDTGSFAHWPSGSPQPGELLQETRSAIRSLRRLLRHNVDVKPQGPSM